MTNNNVSILVATMTGLAEICAEEVSAALSASNWSATTRLMDRLGGDALDGISMVVIISSTYGHGDIPDNGQAFYAAVAALDSLASKSYAVFALGDRTYSDTFCHAGEKWDALFASKGANRIVPLERHDASAGTLAEDEAAIWAAGWSARYKIAA